MSVEDMPLAASVRLRYAIAPVAPASPTSSELSRPGSIDADDFPVPDMEAWMEDEEDDASSATEEDDYGQDIADSDLPSDASHISDADADADDNVQYTFHHGI
eukprot:g68151.t1